MKVLILGHLGMIGSAVRKYYSCVADDVVTIEEPWPSPEFKKKVSSFSGDLIINCTGAIPQKTNDFSINFEVPKFLCDTCPSEVKIINPATDCVFEGDNNKPYEKYHKCDATSDYGKSKIFEPPIGKKNFKSIRTSVIGYDRDDKELLSWFLSEEEPVHGYLNHWWNGVTTYEWAKISHKVYKAWNILSENILQFGTSPISKYELLKIINFVFRANKDIIPYMADKSVNRLLISDYELKPITQQLDELRKRTQEL